MSAAEAPRHSDRHCPTCPERNEANLVLPMFHRMYVSWSMSPASVPVGTAEFAVTLSRFSRQYASTNISDNTKNRLDGVTV